MINLDKANKAFDNYVANYDISIEKINLKIKHSKRVQKIARNLAISLKLEKEEQNLSELIGLLHDIGRFEQIKIYDSFVDSKTIDHADLGVKILFEDGIIRNFIEDKQYDRIIYKAIKNHNKYSIEEGLYDIELLQSKIIKDADKIDILDIVTKRDLKHYYKKRDIGDQEMSDIIYENIKEHKLINNNDKKTDIDKWISTISLIFDVNFKESLKIIKNNNVINKMIDRVEYTNIDTELKIEDIKKIANKYLDLKLTE